MKKKKEEIWELSPFSKAMSNAGWTSREICEADHHKLIKFAQEYAKIILADLKLKFDL